MVLVHQDCMDDHSSLFSICLYLLSDSYTIKAWLKKNPNMSPSHHRIHINFTLPL